MKYLKMFEGMELPKMNKRQIDALAKERRTIDRLKQSGTHDEVLYYYENLKEKIIKASGRPDIFSTNLPFPNTVFELKILLKDKFDMDIDDGVDIEKYLAKKTEKPFMHKVRDKLKSFAEWFPHETDPESLGPPTEQEIERRNLLKDIEDGKWNPDEDISRFGPPTEDDIRRRKIHRDIKNRNGSNIGDFGPM